MSFQTKMVGISLSVPIKAKQTLDRQAAERGLASSMWIGQVFDAGFAAICAREKSMPIADGDLDAIVGATLLLRSENWAAGKIAAGLGVPKDTVQRILDGWKTYRRGMEAKK
jgi:hypothetical protein